MRLELACMATHQKPPSGFLPIKPRTVYDKAQRHEIPHSRAGTTTADTDAAIIEAAKRLLEHENPMLDPAAAAKVIGCGERWLRDGCNHRGLPHHRAGKFLKFSLEDCREIRRMCRVPAEPSKRATAARKTRKAAEAKPKPTKPVLAHAVRAT